MRIYGSPGTLLRPGRGRVNQPGGVPIAQHGDALNLRIAVRVGVAYGSDAPRVQAALLEVAAQKPGILREPAPEVRFESFGD